MILARGKLKYVEATSSSGTLFNKSHARTIPRSTQVRRDERQEV